jgi:hypothetical protein
VIALREIADGLVDADMLERARIEGCEEEFSLPEPVMSRHDRLPL